MTLTFALSNMIVMKTLVIGNEGFIAIYRNDDVTYVKGYFAPTCAYAEYEHQAATISSAD